MKEFKKYFIVGTNSDALQDTMNGMVVGELIQCRDCKYYRPFITEPDVFHYCWLWSKRFKEDEHCARAKRRGE